MSPVKHKEFQKHELKRILFLFLRFEPNQRKINENKWIKINKNDAIWKEKFVCPNI